MHLLFNIKNFVIINLVVGATWIALVLLIVSISENRALLPMPIMNAFIIDCPAAPSSVLIAKPCLTTLSVLIGILQVMLLLFTTIYFFMRSASNDITIEKYKIIYVILLICAIFFTLSLPLLFTL